MPDNLIFWGDSHANGGASAMGGRDMGIAGKQLRDLRAAHPPSSMPRGSRVAIQIGTNDLTINSGWSDTRIRNHAGSVIDTALEMRAAGATPVIFAIPIPERPYTGGNWTQQTLHEFQENARIYNQELRRRANEAGIQFVNYQPNPNDFSRDNLHLSSNGYRRMYAGLNGVPLSQSSPSAPDRTQPARQPDTPNRRSDSPAVEETLPPPTFTPNLNSALTVFLTGDASGAEITALKGAVGVTDSDPPGRLHGQGGVNGASTLERTRTALGGPLSATNHPELYTLARSRYFELTGLPDDRAATPAEIDTAEARIRDMTPEQRAEYQSVSYLLGYNDTRLSNGKINIDGIYGERTESSITAVNTAFYPTPAPANPSAATPVASADITVSSEANVRIAFPSAVALPIAAPSAPASDSGIALRPVPDSAPALASV